MKIIALTLALMISVLVALQVGLATGETITSPSYPETPDASQPSIDIQLPENRKAHNATAVPYSFIVQKPSSWFDYLPVHGDLVSISYVLDGNKVDVAGSGLDQGHYDSKPLSYTGTLTALHEGNHSLQVYVRSVSYYLDPDRPTSGYGWWFYPPANHYMDTISREVIFFVDTTLPRVSILSIENKTYDSGDMSLIVAMDEPPRRIRYCLDNRDYVTMSGNATLTGLSLGPHTLLVCGEDEAGNIGFSETVIFTMVENQESNSESFPTVSVVFVAAFILVAGGLLFYFKKRRPKAAQGGLSRNFDP